MKKNEMFLSLIAMTLLICVFASCESTMFQHDQPPSQPQYPSAQDRYRRPPPGRHVQPDRIHRTGNKADSFVMVEKDVSYKKSGGTSLLLDIYKNKNRTNIHGGLEPALIIIHGGGFEAGSKNTPYLQGLSRQMASLGYVVFTIDYRLAPRYRYLETLSDIKNVVQWIRYRSTIYGINPNKIGVVGFSAGSYFTAMLALDTAPPIDTPGELKAYSHNITCAVIMYGIFDLPDFLITSHGKRQITNLLGKTYEQDPELWKSASPINYVRRNAPPIYLFHGSADTAVPVKQSRKFYRIMKDRGADIQYLELDGAGHGWKHDSEFGRREYPEFIKFLANHLKNP